ncbi:MAG: hypothetical protein K5622_02045 [Endomicrobiaceae bacterium]|nr:hypothetical protein [Endomicrobiaceae bacterium]
MKKILLLSLFVCLAACLGACTKRDKLTHNTMILQIEPAEDISLSIGSEIDLKAIVRNIKMEDVDEPVNWSVTPSELGSFNPGNSKKTSFIAETSGDGTITLSCQGMSVSVNVTVS